VVGRDNEHKAMSESPPQSFDIAPLSGALGAEVRGLDLSRPLDNQALDRLRDAWLTHVVLLFRGQSLTNADLVRFSRHFGALDIAPISDIGISSPPDFPEIFVLSNVVEGGRPIGTLGAGDLPWHSIMSYAPRPPIANLLYAVEVPDQGGESGFLNMYLALETLPAELRAEIEGRRAKQDATTDSAGRLRSGAGDLDVTPDNPGAHHPLIFRHPDTGREALFLGRRPNAEIDGLPPAKSEALLDALWAHATQARFSLQHRWRNGDLIFWDNRVSMYRRAAFAPEARRILHRTQIRSSLFGY
jgi:taurine dioxygenase